MNNFECIFCKIVSGKTESSKIYEDNQILAFLDIQPVHTGQVLIIPKEHIDHFTDIPDEVALEIFSRAHKISKLVKRKLNPERVGLVIHGYGVPHAHLIIVPQHSPDDITSGKMAAIDNGKIIFTIKNLPIASRDELDKIATLLKE